MKESKPPDTEVPTARVEPRSVGERVERAHAQAKHVARGARRVARGGARFGRGVAVGLLVMMLVGAVVGAIASGFTRRADPPARDEPPRRVGRNLYEIQEELRRLGADASESTPTRE